MVNFHPDENMLIEYGAGSLEWALAISIKAHISMCPKCRSEISRLNAIGSAFFEEPDVATLQSSDESDSFNKLMQAIEARSSTADQAAEPGLSVRNSAEKSLPKVIQRMLPTEGKLKWRRISPSLKEARLCAGQNQFEICLHKIKRGGKAVEHDHGGREITVVLQGSFSDENGTYQVGDFIMCEPGQRHRPTATQNQDCLCLSVSEAPVKVTGFMGKLINPFLSFQAR